MHVNAQVVNLRALRIDERQNMVPVFQTEIHILAVDVSWFVVQALRNSLCPTSCYE